MKNLKITMTFQNIIKTMLKNEAIFKNSREQPQLNNYIAENY